MEAESFGNFDEVAINAADGALGGKENDPETADSNDEDGGRLIDAEPEDRERYPGEARDWPQHPNDPGKRRLERAVHAGRDAKDDAEGRAAGEPNRVMPEAEENGLAPDATLHFAQESRGQLARCGKQGRREQTELRDEFPDAQKKRESDRRQEVGRRAPHRSTRVYLPAVAFT